MLLDWFGARFSSPVFISACYRTRSRCPGHGRQCRHGAVPGHITLDSRSGGHAAVNRQHGSAGATVSPSMPTGQRASWAAAHPSSFLPQAAAIGLPVNRSRCPGQGRRCRHGAVPGHITLDSRSGGHAAVNRQHGSAGATVSPSLPTGQRASWAAAHPGPRAGPSVTAAGIYLNPEPRRPRNEQQYLRCRRWRCPRCMAAGPQREAAWRLRNFKFKDGKIEQKLVLQNPM